MYPKGNLFIPVSHGQLEAILKEPTGPRRGVALVCHPHPLGGGTMHNKVVFRAAAGLVDERLMTLENLHAFARAGADLIITYHAREVLEKRWL